MKQFLFILAALALAIIAFEVSGEAQKKLSQAEILDGITFDKVVLTTLVAMEHNYKAKERLCPQIHKDDYVAIILNTAKRLALADNRKQKKVSTVIPAKQDTSNTKK